MSMTGRTYANTMKFCIDEPRARPSLTYPIRQDTWLDQVRPSTWRTGYCGLELNLSLRSTSITATRATPPSMASRGPNPVGAISPPP